MHTRTFDLGTLRGRHKIVASHTSRRQGIPIAIALVGEGCKVLASCQQVLGLVRLVVK